MRAGKLRQKIDIGNFSTVSDGAGGSVATLRIDKSVWGELKPISGNRELDGSKINLDELFEVRLRFDDYQMLSKKNRLVYQDRVFVIHSIIVVNETKKEFKLKVYQDSTSDLYVLYLYDQNLNFITDENGEKITV
jgi:SPP1 family predicted phage head-tail adaptor